MNTSQTPHRVVYPPQTGRAAVQPSAPLLEDNVILPPPIPPRMTKSKSADVTSLRFQFESQSPPCPPRSTSIGWVIPETLEGNSDRIGNTGSLSDLQGLDFAMPKQVNALKDNRAAGLSASEDNINHYTEETSKQVYPDIRSAFYEVLPKTPEYPSQLRYGASHYPQNNTTGRPTYPPAQPTAIPRPMLPGQQTCPPGFVFQGNSGIPYTPNNGQPLQFGTYNIPNTGSGTQNVNFGSNPPYPNQIQPQSVYNSLQPNSTSPFPFQDPSRLTLSSGYTLPHANSWNDLNSMGSSNSDNPYSMLSSWSSNSVNPVLQPTLNQRVPDSDNLIHLGWNPVEDAEYLTLEAFDPLYEKIPDHVPKNKPSGPAGLGIYSVASNVDGPSSSNIDQASHVHLPPTEGNYEDVLEVMSKTENRNAQSKPVNPEDNIYMCLGDLASQELPKRPSRPPRPPRPKSMKLFKKSVKNGDYEMLRPMTFIDEESKSFCEMVSEVKQNFLSTDVQSNMGCVISGISGATPHESMTVKVVIHADFAKEIIPFTCDVDLLVEHVISQVLYSEFEDTSSLTAADYTLKVYDRTEYLLNMYPLSYYTYVHQCLKYDRDIKFSLCKRDQIPLPLLRTVDDDNKPVYFPRDFFQKDPGEVSRDSLDILMETFYREIERLRDQTLQGKAEASQCRSLTQSVKAVCAILAKIETISISKSVSRVQDIVSRLSHRTSQPPEMDAIGDCVYSDPSEIQDVDLGLRCNLLENLQEAMDELMISVQQLVNLYCRTFHTDFILFAQDDGYTETNDVTGLIDNFLIQVATAHRIPVSWLNMYEEYIVDCSIHHSGRRLGQSLLTKAMTVSKTGLCERILFDEWIQFEDLLLCSLPRESRLCLTLYGLKTIPNANANSTNEDTGKVKTALGGATVQLFDHKSHLVQGPQLVILRPGKEADPLGPSLTSLLPESVLLQVNLPELGKHIVFPRPYESEIKIQKTFFSLPTEHQEDLMGILQKDCITELTSDEKLLLWDKRHHLLENPAFLPKVLASAHGWDWACLSDIYLLLRQWLTPSPTDAFELLMPHFADQRVREFAVICLRNLDIDEMMNYLPQLVQALKFESYHVSPLAELLLERACNSVRFAHDLFWLLKEAAQDSLYRRRYQLMFGAVMSVAGEALMKEFRKQEELMKILGTTAEKVKSARDKEVTLKRELEVVYELFDDKKSILLPLDCSMEVSGIDLKSCSYFTSNAFPLKLVFKNQNFYAEPIYTMFKVGDDLRQDMLTLQLIEIMDNLWLKEGLDLKMITFSVLSTGPKRGMVELVTESETVRKIQAGYGLTGSFKDRPLKEWLQKHNITELDYQKAIDNFMRSCAGYCVATYVLGICDRHNDNIMLKQSGHMFHIDFGKFLGDSQMFGTFKRDRVPFVLTSDMAYVINDGERQSSKFQEFVELCCQAFNILRKNANLFLSLFTLMSKSGIPGVSENAAAYVQTALLPGQSNAEATAFFTRMIDESLKSVFTQFNFFIHNLAQLKFSSHNEGALLSFVPKTYSINMDGKIKSIEVLTCQKRYIPEKHYVYIIKVEREQHRVPSFIFRRFSEFVEFRDKLVAQFPLTAWHVLPTRLILGRSHIKSVAESRKAEIEKFLKDLLLKTPEISGSDLVYTFFHPLLRDEQDVADQTNAPRTGEVTMVGSDVTQVKGQLKLALQYKKDALSVMIMHAKDLGCSQPVAPSPYVKTYLLPDPFKETKRKTKVVKNTNHPVYNEILLYKVSSDEVRNKILQVTVWDHDILKENKFMGAVFVKLRDVNLTQETIKWYPLGNLQVSISEMLA